MTSELNASIKALLAKLKDIEIAHGNLQEPSEDERIRSLKSLVSYLDSSDKQLSPEDLSEGAAEKVFRQIVNLLSTTGLSANEIVNLINEALKPFASLPYCNEDEVRDAIHQ